MSNTSCNNGRGDELARQRIEVRCPSGRVRVREEGASRDGDRPGVTQEPVISDTEPVPRLRAAQVGSSETCSAARHTSRSSPVSAIGHVRYSTVGGTAMLRNVQPFLAAYWFGQVAMAHNGNLVNYHALRNRLEAQGSIFNTSSDTEVILHLIATSLSRIYDTCEHLPGANSLLFLTASSLPCATHSDSGPWSWVLALASETCMLPFV
jgi:hypothetical protein